MSLAPELEALLRFAQVRVLVIGDSVLDVWLAGDAHRIGREAPVPTVEVTSVTRSPGAGANAAANLAALGAQVRFLSVVGSDDAGRALLAELDRGGVQVDGVLVEPGRTTATKQRLTARGHLLARFDQAGPPEVPAEVEAELARRVAAVRPDVDLVVLADYGLGVCGPPVAAALAAGGPKVPLVVDSRDPGRFRDLHPLAVKPNRTEVSGLLGAAGPVGTEEVLAGAAGVLDRTGAELAAVTLDADGALLLSRSAEPVRVGTRPQPDSHAAGAGDTFTAALALALAVGLEPAAALRTAVAAGEVVVAATGTAVCTAAQLALALLRRQPTLVGVEELRAALVPERRAGRRLVLTSGCFDVLHRGHVQFLREARAAGDLLVVALNSDPSVARLKGPRRPVNPLADRAAVLGALSSVDHVVAFEEDTPAGVLRALCPDVFVKGGDYTVDMLPEGEVLAELGIEARMLGYLGEHSTTRVIDLISERYGLAAG